MQTLSRLWKDGTYWRICLISAFVCALLSIVGFYLNKPAGSPASNPAQSTAAPSASTSQSQAASNPAPKSTSPAKTAPAPALKFKAPLREEYKSDAPMVVLTWALENKKFNGTYEIWAKHGSSIGIRFSRFKQIARLAEDKNRYEHTSVDYGRVYQYYVLAKDQTGSVKSTKVRVETHPPRLTAPQLRYQYSFKGPKLILEWDKVSASFQGNLRLFRADKAGGREFESVGLFDQDQVRFEDTNVFFGQEYTYYLEVDSGKAGVKKAKSRVVKITFPQPSYTVGRLEARPFIKENQAAVSLAWPQDSAKMDQISGFTLFRRPASNKKTDEFKKVSDLGLRYDAVDRNPLPGTTYIYKITPMLVNNLPGTSAQTRVTLPPAPPLNLSAKFEASGKTRLSWQSPQNGANPVAGYRIYRYPRQYEVEFKDPRYPKYRQECFQASTGPETAWTDPDPLPFCKAYGYAVTAVDSKQNESTFAFMDQGIIRYQVFGPTVIHLSFEEPSVLGIEWRSERSHCSFGWYEIEQCTKFGPDGQACQNWMPVSECFKSQRASCHILKNRRQQGPYLVRIRTVNKNGLPGPYTGIRFFKGTTQTIQYTD